MNDKKLIVATVSFDMVMAVDNDSTIQENISTARKYLRSAVNDTSLSEFDISLELYNGTNAKGWDDMCCPYGETGGNLRIKDFTNGE